jgi:hypothetical protein
MDLEIYSSAFGRTYPFSRPILLVGRDEECELSFDSSKLSRRHCAIALVDGKVFVRDLASTNGTRVNGAVVDYAELKIGDALSIGDVELTIRATTESSMNRRPSDFSQMIDGFNSKPQVGRIESSRPSVEPTVESSQVEWLEPSPADASRVESTGIKSHVENTEVQPAAEIDIFADVEVQADAEALADDAVFEIIEDDVYDLSDSNGKPA